MRGVGVVVPRTRLDLHLRPLHSGHRHNRKKGGRFMLVKRHHLFAAAAVTLALGLLGTAANAADIFSLTSTTFKDGTMMPKKVANSTRECADQSELRRRERLAAIVLDRRAGRHQELRPDDGRSRRPRRRRRQSIGSPMAFRRPSPALPRARSASRPTNMSAARAPRASASIPVPARRPARRRITIRSC